MIAWRTGRANCFSCTLSFQGFPASRRQDCIGSTRRFAGLKCLAWGLSNLQIGAQRTGLWWSRFSNSPQKHHFQMNDKGHELLDLLWFCTGSCFQTDTLPGDDQNAFVLVSPYPILKRGDAASAADPWFHHLGFGFVYVLKQMPYEVSSQDNFWDDRLEAVLVCDVCL